MPIKAKHYINVGSHCAIRLSGLTLALPDGKTASLYGGVVTIEAVESSYIVRVKEGNSKILQDLFGDSTEFVRDALCGFEPDHAPASDLQVRLQRAVWDHQTLGSTKRRQPVPV